MPESRHQEVNTDKQRIAGITFNLVLLIPLVISILFFYFPLFFILSDGVISPSGIITLEFLMEALEDPLNQYFIRFTMNQAIISAIATVIIGLPGAYIFAKYDFIGHKVLKTIFTIPFVLPPVVVVLGFVLLLGPSGILTSLINELIIPILNSILSPIFLPLNDILLPRLNSILSLDIPEIKILPIELYQTFEGIIIVHTFYNVPIVLRLVSSAWSKANVDMEEVATTLGSQKYHFFRYITFPQISSAVLASGILTFLYCFTSFAVVLSLGGFRYRTLEVQIYSLFFYPPYDYQQAAALALLQLIISSLLIIVYLYLSEPTFKRERPASFFRTIRDLPLIAIIPLIGIASIVAGLGLLAVFILTFFFIQVDLVLMLLLGLIGLVFWRYGRTTPLTVGEIRSRPKIPLENLLARNKLQLVAIVIYIGFLMIFLLSPIALIFISAFYDRISDEWSITAFFTLLGFKSTDGVLIWAPESIPALGARTTPIGLIFNSVFFALITMILSALFGVLSIYSIRRSEFLSRHAILAMIVSWSLILPLVTSSITLGLGMLRAFGFIRISSHDAWIPILLAHLIAAYPFVSRTISTAYNKIDFNLIEIGKTLGASKWHIFRTIEFPIISSGILAGATFALAISFGEFGATYFIARSEFTTMTIGIYKFLAMKQLQNSAIMASILVFICVITFLLVQKLGNDEFQF